MASIPPGHAGAQGSRCGDPGSASQGRLHPRLGLAEVVTASATLPQSRLPPEGTPWRVPPSPVATPSQVPASRVPPCQSLPCHTTTPPFPQPPAPPAPPSRPTKCPRTGEAVAGGGPGTSPPRKRQRLVHLSTEEKASRRKLKNRVAAQSARDRKMALMCDLEKKAEELRAKNRLLVEKNRALKAQSLNLAQQNLELRRRLSKDVFEEQEQAAQDKCLDDHSVVAGSSESAVLRGAVPQQWVLTRPPSQLVVLTFAVLLTALRTPSVMICLVSWMSWIWICLEMLISLWAKTLKITQEVHLVKQKKKIPYLPPHLQIWGAHQLSWTPIMI
uniref:X-box-binding protein 1 n=1 Tax=Petromyzon marinus TaxID=7757 RepID=A0AAJ7SQQ7_PETMA|nr:X-box-binding protein 1-like isoform X1 [Petromyzon marinus]